MPDPNQMDVKRVSPFDVKGQLNLVQIQQIPDPDEWVPSRFNARTVDEEGNVIVWNTLSGNISLFRSPQRPQVESLLSQQGFQGPLDSTGKYLRERGYIVARENNEYRKFQMLFGEQHYRTDRLELILLASEDCNFRCSYCYEDFKRGTMRPHVRENIKAMVLARARGLRTLSVSWFGGEPLYGMEAIEDLAPFFLEVAEKFNLEYASSMTTNGYLLDPEVARKLISWKVRQFQITMDGLREYHDANRPTRDGEGSFDRIFENLKALKQSTADFFVRIRINFDRNNHGTMDQFIALLEETFQRDRRFGIGFAGVGKWGGPNDESLDVCGVFEAQSIRANLHRSATEHGFTIGTLADNPRPGSAACYAARPYNMIIGASGQIMKCTIALDKDPTNIVGELGEGGELRFNNDHLSRWVEPAFESDTNCQKCHMLPACQGISCPLMRFERKISPCEATCKHNLHNELINTMKAKVAKAKVVELARS